MTADVANRRRVRGRLLILTGASGAGKTTLGRAFERRHQELVEVFRFDSVGVPSPKEMVWVHGSGENWQRCTMHRWVERIAPLLGRGRNVLIEGQVRRSFIVSACETAGISNYRPVLIDCSDKVRRARLVEDRDQPELANSDMMHWAAFLRNDAIACGDPIIDTDVVSIDEAVGRISQLFLV